MKSCTESHTVAVRSWGVDCGTDTREPLSVAAKYKAVPQAKNTSYRWTKNKLMKGLELSHREQPKHVAWPSNYLDHHHFKAYCVQSRELESGGDCSVPDINKEIAQGRLPMCVFN